MFILIKSLMSVKLSHVGSKTRSLGQILEKPCVGSRGLIFGPMVMKRAQNVYLDKISDDFKMGHAYSRGHIFSPICIKLCQNVCLDEITDKYQNGHIRSNLTRTYACNQGVVIFHIIGKAQVSNSRAIMALFFIII